MCWSPTLAAVTTNYQTPALKTHISRIARSISCLLCSGALAVFRQSGEGVPCVKLTCTKQVTRLPFLMPISDLPFLSLLPDREGRSSLCGPTAILPLCRLCSTPSCRGQTSQLGATFICWRYDKPWPSYLLSHRWKLET